MPTGTDEGKPDAPAETSATHEAEGQESSAVATVTTTEETAPSTSGDPGTSADAGGGADSGGGGGGGE